MHRTATVPLVRTADAVRTGGPARPAADEVLRLGSGARLQANLDLYNALNGSTVLGVNSNYGPSWLEPAPAGEGDAILPAAGSSSVGNIFQPTSRRRNDREGDRHRLGHLSRRSRVREEARIKEPEHAPRILAAMIVSSAIVVGLLFWPEQPVDSQSAAQVPVGSRVDTYKQMRRWAIPTCRGSGAVATSKHRWNGRTTFGGREFLNR